jgi:hypothetical protein
VHREPNATLLGRKIIVVCDNIIKGPHLFSTRGRDNAQYMVVEGKSKPAYAVIDIKLSWVKER